MQEPARGDGHRRFDAAIEDILRYLGVRTIPTSVPLDGFIKEMPVKKSPKKISLNRETLHQLESCELEHAAGGATVVQKTCISCTRPTCLC